MEVPSTLLATSGAYTYVAVKASLHGTYTSLFGLNEDEVKALVKKFSSHKKDVINGVLPKATLVDVINGVLLKATPIDAINALGQLGYRVVCSTGEAEIVWTMQRDLFAAMCQCGGSHGPLTQSLDELEFERGLWFAAQYGDMERARHLLDNGFEVDRKDAAGYTALHYAARNGHLTVCRLLLDRGACVNAITGQGRATALHRAAAVGKLDVVKYLIGKKANVLLKDADGQNALHRAAIGGHFEICQLLVKLEAELGNDVDNRGNKPQDYAKSEDLSFLLNIG